MSEHIMRDDALLLVIDAGNTNVVFAVHNGQSWVGRWRISTEGQRTADEYAVWLLGLMERAGFSASYVKQAIIGTVVPNLLYDLRRFCRQWLGLEPLIANNDLDWRTEISLENPDELGVDRRLNGLAAHHFYGVPIIIVDFGTATTFDVVDKDGCYCGGVIAPGVNLSMEALHRAAARLPRVGIGRPAEVVGRSTVIAMRSGLFWGYIGLVEGIVDRIRKERSEIFKVIATGGLAPLFSEGTTLFDDIAPDLTLEGLRLLSMYNQDRFHRRKQDSDEPVS